MFVKISETWKATVCEKQAFKIRQLGKQASGTRKHFSCY